MLTIEQVKNELLNYKGKNVTIKCNLGRNKYEKYNVVIKDVYNNVFLVELLDMKGVFKSFSFSDLITKTIKITY